MEWVEKTGRSLEEAKEQALGELGVAEHDAELVVLSEPKTGLFGRVRGEARVRARVRPAQPRPKRQRRQRERSRADGEPGRPSEGRSRSARRRSEKPGDRTVGRRGPAPADGTGGAPAEGPATGTSSSSRRRRRRRKAAAARRQEQDPVRADRDAIAGDGQRAARADASMGRRDVSAEEEDIVSEGVSLQEQGAVAKEFLEGLIGRFGLDATVEVRELDDQTVEVAARGDGLGILVGPKGATLASLQDVTRTVVQKHFPHKTDRILVDVAGYRERRAAALRRFTQEIASDVLESRTERALEPMSPADRKVVHDAVVEIEGVSSSSRGEEPRRFVVISPEG